MKMKLMSAITLSAILFTSTLPAVSFASNDSAQKKDVQIVQSNENGKENKIDEDKVLNVTDSVYGQNGKSEEKQDEHKKDNLGQIDKEVLTNVIDTLFTKANIVIPEEITTLLQEKNISINDMVKLTNSLSADTGVISDELRNSILKSYADALVARLEDQNELLENLNGSLDELSDLYDTAGELEKAINVQRKAVKAAYKDIDTYRKLGEKLAKTGDDSIKVFLSGNQVEFPDAKPVIVEDRTLIPVAAIATSLDSQVVWDEVYRTVTITNDNIQIILKIGDATAYIDGVEMDLDVPAQIMEDRTMVPVRFINEAFKKIVKWEPEFRSVVIYDEE